MEQKKYFVEIKTRIVIEAPNTGPIPKTIQKIMRDGINSPEEPTVIVVPMDIKVRNKIETFGTRKLPCFNTDGQKIGEIDPIDPMSTNS